MTPAEIETAARQQYNAVGDTNWSAAEIYTLITLGCNEMARFAKCIEKTATDTSVASTRAYSNPTRWIEYKRIEYDGQKLEPITFREDDQLSLTGAASTDTGTPGGYAQFASSIYLRPIPATSALTITFYYYATHAAITTSSQTIEIPEHFHGYLVDYVLYRMYLKDKDPASASEYKGNWIQGMKEARAWQARKKRGDAPAHVHDEGI